MTDAIMFDAVIITMNIIFNFSYYSNCRCTL